MKIDAVITLVEGGIRLGLSAAEIVQRLCVSHGGETLPTLAVFEAHVDAVRKLPDLASQDKAER